MNRTFIIAEAGVNHNGDIEIAKKLCDAAKNTGADAVKFQTWKTENIITENVAQAKYQVNNTGCNESQFDMLKKLELSYAEFAEVKEYCDKIGIMFLSTADDKESLDFLLELNIPYIKIGSGDIGNIPFLRYIGKQNKKVILSTGMSNLGLIELSIKELRQSGTENISLLHCTTNYPCSYDEVNLNAMNTLADAFKLPVGYSDHTEGIEIAIAAVAKGARIIEKHFTLDKNMSGPDHKASTEPREFKQMIDAIRNIECAFGSGIKSITDSERDISKVVKKRIVAKRFIHKGEFICEEAITVKRNNEGEPAYNWDSVIGTKAVRDYGIDCGICLGEK